MAYGLEILAYTAYAAAIVSAGVTTYSAIEQAETQKRTAQYNKEAFDLEAHNQEMLAAEAIRRERQQNRRKMAALRNSLSQNGTLSTEGTPLAIIGESSANLELGIQDAARAASTQANALRAQGAMTLWQGDQLASASYLQAGASALGGVSSITGSYLRDAKDGIVPGGAALYSRKSAG